MTQFYSDWDFNLIEKKEKETQFQDYSTTCYT